MYRLIILTLFSLIFCSTANAITFTSNATVVNHDYGTEQVIVTNGAKVTFQNDTWGAFNNDAANSYEGRLTVLGAGSTAYVDGGLFHNGGCSDGIQLLGNSPANYGTAIVSNTEFVGLTQGSCRAHVDPIQMYGGNLTLTNSYLHGNNTGIMSPDSAGTLTATNNVFIGGGYAWSMCLGGMTGAQITHNYSSTNWSIGLGCTNGGQSNNNTIRNNVSNVVNSGSNTIDHNVNSATTVGGTGRCSFATPNAGVASDGTVIGLNNCNAVPPPPVNNIPVGAFTVSPALPAVGDTVTFDVSGSTCQDAPCSYGITDEPGAWPIKTGPGPTLTFAFTTAGTKHATLIVTDANGDTSTPVEHDVIVGSVAPPACDATCVANYQAQIAALNNQVTTLTAQVATLNTQIATLTSQNSTLTAQNAVLQQKLADIQTILSR